MLSLRKRPMNTEWCDTTALYASRRYAGLTLLLMAAGLFLSLVNLRQSERFLPSMQTLVLTVRFHEPEQEQVQPVSEKRRILADESSYTVPDMENKKETPPPEPVKNITPDKPKPKPKPPAREKNRPVKSTPPVSALETSSETIPQTETGSAVSAPAVKAEISATSKQMALQILVQEIERRKSYPKQARRIGAQGVVTLLIRIGKDGKVQECSVSKNCGIGVLDLETARLGAKLIGLDTGVRGGAFSVHIPVRYSLH